MFPLHLHSNLLLRSPKVKQPPLAHLRRRHLCFPARQRDATTASNLRSSTQECVAITLRNTTHPGYLPLSLQTLTSSLPLPLSHPCAYTLPTNPSIFYDGLSGHARTHTTHAQRFPLALTIISRGGVFSESNRAGECVRGTGSHAFVLLSLLSVGGGKPKAQIEGIYGPRRRTSELLILGSEGV